MEQWNMCMDLYAKASVWKNNVDLPFYVNNMYIYLCLYIEGENVLCKNSIMWHKLMYTIA